jgi:ubiquinone/menaquinone biosynthesis C-methylase UbiE
MTGATTTYRWNTSAAVEAYDAAAPTIHPFYETVQGEVLDQIPFAPGLPFVAVDLGGGSGRLAERFLERFSHAQLTVVDQSEPFLALAERRLKQFGTRGRIIQRRLQDDWALGGRIARGARRDIEHIGHPSPGAP